MAKSWSVFAITIIFVLSFSVVTVAQTSRPAGESAAKAIPRTSDGKPDLSGVWWQYDNSRGKRTGLPLTEWAAEQYQYNRDPRPGGENRGRIELDPRAGKDCFPPSTNFLMTYGDPFEIIQSPRRVLVFYEYDQWIRQLWLDDKAPDNVEDLDLSWMGTSFAKWDGDTLVVDTVRMHPISWLDGAGNVRSDQLRIEERFRRTSYETLDVETRFTDPIAFTMPWTQTMRYEFKPGWKLSERIYCEERWQQRGIYGY
jgi:hypothetical protein